MFQILLLSGDVEKNPGPENWYSLKHPNMCGFFRAAVYFIFQGQKLLPVDKKELELCIDINQGFLDMQNLFVNHFDILQLNLKNLKKNISRFHDLNKQWARNNNEAKEEYYDSFSPQKWVKLTKTEQNNHTLFCKECQKTYCHITAKFPSKANLYEDARKENPILLAKSLKKQVKKEKNTLKIATNKVCQEMNSGFISTYGVSFEESFMSLNKVEKQTRESRRQLKKKHYKEAVTTINEDGGTTVVDRLYGSGSSLRKWDRERKKKYFETVPEAEERTSAKKLKVQNGLKKPKNHTGPFSSYQIDPSLMEVAVTWSANDKISWRKIGEQYIRGRDGKIPSNSGQIAKQFLEDKENNENFVFSYQGKNLPSNRVRRQKKASYVLCMFSC